MGNKIFKTKKEPTLVKRIISAVLVLGCVVASWSLPLWHMKLIAPMYPQGLNMVAYGSEIKGDLYELNIINHYVGMKHIKPEEFSTMALFPVGLAVVLILALIPIFLPKLRRLCALASFFFPIIILAFIQYYLYEFGHGLNPDAPIKIPEFMPIVIGSSTIVNFTAHSMIGWGIGVLFMAAFITGFGYRLMPGGASPKPMMKLTPTQPAMKSAVTTGLFLLLIFVANSSLAQNSLQQRIDAAKSGETIIVPSGVYNGSLVISKPLTLIGESKPEIRGDKIHDVISIKSSNVTVCGFKISLSGTEITEEASGIRAQGDHIRITDNIISQVYFGIHILSADSVELIHNIITPGTSYAGRPGHAINAWSVNTLIVKDNTIDDARDGILLTYAKNAVVVGNKISHCRYGLHSMYSRNVEFHNNYVCDNLLGLALMYSKFLVVKNNTVSQQRRGSSPYGFLLKDIDNVTLEDNLIEANQIGIFAEGISMEFGSSSTIKGNTIVGNMCGVSVQSNATFSFTQNNVMENMTDVRKQTDHVNEAAKWEGNFWSNYRGYDKDKDGSGDLSYRVDEIGELDYETNSPAQALLYTPGYLVIESAIRLFPLFGTTPVFEDHTPRMYPQLVTKQASTVPEHAYLFSAFSSILLFGGVASALFFKPFSGGRA